ncbi:hypothetical protein HMPREF9182_0781 [Streptococcus sp. oral taxon 056 str. F0418]|nr:hypothetical protein HMPREF9182_0781 [Streptococcus sp. oral taxon 056 str. F0418]
MRTVSQIHHNLFEHRLRFFIVSNLPFSLIIIHILTLLL